MNLTLPAITVSVKHVNDLPPLSLFMSVILDETLPSLEYVDYRMTIRD